MTSGQKAAATVDLFPLEQGSGVKNVCLGFDHEPRAFPSTKLSDATSK